MVPEAYRCPGARSSFDFIPAPSQPPSQRTLSFQDHGSLNEVKQLAQSPTARKQKGTELLTKATPSLGTQDQTGPLVAKLQTLRMH